MAVPAYEEVRDFFPCFVDFDCPVIPVVTRFGADDLANGFPIGNVDVCPGGGLGFGEGGLGNSEVVLDVLVDRKDVGVIVEAADEGWVVRRGNGGEGCCEGGAGVLVLGLVKGLEDGLHG